MNNLKRRLIIIKKHLKRHNDIYVINGLTFIVAILFFEIVKKHEVLIPVFATGLSISFGLRQYKIENDKIFKELFLMFNKKYDEEFNNTLNRIERNSREVSDLQLTTEEIEIVIDYLNFCSEEYLWYVKGRIDENVWTAWENGMKYYLDIRPIRIIVDSQKAQKDSYYGLFEKLKIK